jgi:hypothetical protein
LNLPWVYGGCIGAEGQTLTILPSQPPCFRCVMSEPPPPGSTPTCDTAGILGPAVNVVASIQACEAIKILAGRTDAVSKALTVIDLWDNRIRQLNVEKLRTGGGCSTCRGEEFPWLSGQRGSHAAVLCGRNSVQLNPSQDGTTGSISLDAVADKLAAVGKVTRNKYLLRATIGDHTIALFPDGRAIISGTSEIAEARTVYAKYIGS